MPSTHEAMLQEVDTEIERLRIVRDWLASKVSATPGSQVTPAAQAVPRKTAVLPSRESLPNFDRLNIENEPRHLLAARLLKEHGKPMSTPAIVAKAKAAGLDSRGREKTLPNAFYTAMVRHKELFCKTGPGEWALVEWVGKPALQ